MKIMVEMSYLGMIIHDIFAFILGSLIGALGGFIGYEIGVYKCKKDAKAEYEKRLTDEKHLKEVFTSIYMDIDDE